MTGVVSKVVVMVTKEAPEVLRNLSSDILFYLIVILDVLLALIFKTDII